MTDRPHHYDDYLATLRRRDSQEPDWFFEPEMANRIGDMFSNRASDIRFLLTVIDQLDSRVSELLTINNALNTYIGGLKGEL